MKNVIKKTSNFFRSHKKLTVVFVIIIGLLAFYFLRNRNKDLDFTKVEKGTVEEVLILSGSISADEYAALKFPTSGKVAWVGTKEGESVEKNDALIKLDTTVLYSAYLQADASLRRFQASLDKAYDDVQGHEKDESFAQRETRTYAETNKDSAYRALIGAQYNLNNSTIYAPFDGVVTYIAHPYSGAETMFSETQVEVVNPDTIYFDVSADQSEVVDIKLGQEVKIKLDSFDDKEFDGVVKFVGFTPRIGEAGTIYKVRVEFKNPDFDINTYRIGMTGDARFVLDKREDVLYVPSRFVNSKNGNKYVKVGKKELAVELGIEGEDVTQIIGDIKEGDIVVD